MWLLNAHNCSLELFEGEGIPRYAILSHRWGNPVDEVSFSDIQSLSHESKKGYLKIKFCCEQALADGLDYCWIDTCCVDKSNSAELSEAINSMYQWYQKSEFCYAYLSDVKKAAFANSGWFRRGWTLQELIAPARVRFYAAAWEFIGTKDELADKISTITGIPWSALQGNVVLEAYSNAEKMKWASERETTRVEDLAYCLLGIFGVNMPMIYGERDKAFFRLQEQILRQSPDLSILSWERIDDSCSTALAPSPCAFGACEANSSPTSIRTKYTKGTTTLNSMLSDAIDTEGPTLIPNGLAITLCLIPHSFGVYLAPVCTFWRPSDENQSKSSLCTILQRSRVDGKYRRICYGQDSLLETTADCIREFGKAQRIVIASPVRLENAGHTHHHTDLTTVYGFEIGRIDYAALALLRKDRKDFSKAHEMMRAVHRSPVMDRFLHLPSQRSGIAGLLCLSPRGRSSVLVFCLNFDFSPFCLLLDPDPISKDERPGQPQYWTITLPQAHPTALCFGNNKHMLSLASWLRSTSQIELSHQGIVQRDCAKLFWAHWRIDYAAFELCKNVNMEWRLEPTGYKVSLNTRERHPKSNLDNNNGLIPPRHKSMDRVDWTVRPLQSASLIYRHNG